MSRLGRTLQQRLNDLSRQDTSGCIVWTGSLHRKGYGQVRVDGKGVKAHRAAWVCRHGEIPAGMHVCHRCDNRACINVDHLFLGTNADNVKDRDAKGRQAKLRGELNPIAILRPSQVLSIRSARGIQREIGARYGITQSAVSAIKRKKNWAHLPDGDA